LTTTPDDASRGLYLPAANLATSYGPRLPAANPAEDSADTPATPSSRRPAYARWAAGLIVGGVLLRGSVLLVGLPPTNSDEATMGLMARHIAAGQAAPIWFYGQEYMGSVEAWVAAPLFALFGSSTGLLRLPNLLWYALLMVIVYHLGVRLYSHRVALIALGLLALGSDRVFKNQLLSIGGYPEIVPMVGALFLFAVLLVTGSQRRILLFGLWGLVAGLALWDHWIALPYIGTAGVLLLAFTWREFIRRPGLALFGGVLLGAAPMLVDNLTGRTNSVHWFLYLNDAGHEKLASASLGDHLYNGFIVGVPMGTGICAPSRCWPVVGWWGVAYPAVLLVAGVIAALALRRVSGPDRARYAARLALAVAGVSTMLFYARSPASVLHPIESNRYLALLGVTVPVLVGTLWLAAGWLRYAGRAVLAFVFVFALAATVTSFERAAQSEREERLQAALVAALDEQRITGIYSDYWTCIRLSFAVDERIACATIEVSTPAGRHRPEETVQLKRGHDRYRPYRARVDNDPTRVYALRTGGETEREFVAYAAAQQVSLEMRDVGGYRIYRPARPLDVPR
jgi:hypothetical protein